jgi:ATP-dependent Clp protease ATP-binding subunit ClpB
VIQKQLIDKLALALLEGRFGEGDVVRVDASDGELVFERSEAPAERPAEPATA